MTSHTDVISPRTFGEMSLEEQQAYWADAAEYCRDIVRTEHADMSAERLERTLKNIARYAAQAEDPAGPR
ncbi:MAG: hypothetical protein QOF58_1715, partial [Pseudonocardiales bacterium]|nr:hypothetical protein [Pseudonocardiales bacterium]